MKRFFVFTLVAAATAVLSLNAPAQEPTAAQTQTPSAETLQLIEVFAPQGETFATVQCFERAGADAPWRQTMEDMRATVARNGVAEIGEKREKDGKSPAAEFGIGFLFGVADEAPEGVKLPYRQATATDFWIDEAEDPLYNRWISGEEPKVSHENLILQDPRYDLCLTSMYNVNPTVPAKGSAIFLHLWKEPGHKTSGCVALSREDVLRILRWLDPKKTPHIRIVGSAPPAKR